MGDLTRNFSKYEFECGCGCGLNTISTDLVERLQVLRNFVGVPITVNSGIRCLMHNSLVGGSRGSQHLLGTAADIFTPSLPLVELHDKAQRVFQDGGIGVYAGDDGFLHVDVRDHVARWGDINGEKVGYHAAVAAIEGENDVGMA